MSNKDKIPEEAEPVLAKIEVQGDLGKESWSEVVYHNGTSWASYQESPTFEKGEQVVDWIYVKNIWGDTP